MVVILVLGTFAVFILIDAILSSRKLAQPAAVPAEQPKSAAVGPVVEGFLVPEGIRYHPGHSWLLRERTNVVRVGVDEFAAALLGPVQKLELPKPGHWIRQGQRAFGFLRGDQKAEIISPIEGEIVEINTDVVKDPALIRQDPYGKGWLMTVFVPDEENTGRNLLPPNLVRSWMREAAERLYGMQHALAGASAADGGRPADDLSVAIPDKSWTDLTAEFFLTR